MAKDWLDPESDLVPKDELEQLDAENRRLKRQLAAKLRDVNKELTAMLRRLRENGETSSLRLFG